MSEYQDLITEIDSKVSSGAAASARDDAIPYINAILQEYHPSGRISASFVPRDAIGVLLDRHLRLTIENGAKRLLVSEDLISRMFGNALLSFKTVATFCETYPVRGLARGTAVIDIEDGSNDGDYERIAFCSALPQASLVVDDYYVQHRGYAGLKADIDGAWIPWEQREAKIVWRGSTTGRQSGLPAAEEWNWQWLPRLHLCDIAARSPCRSRLDVGVTNTVQISDPRAEAAVLASGFVKTGIPRLGFLRYRYMIDIDGNANAWNGSFGALLMGACVLKVGSPHGFRQWYYDRLIAGVHYLPVRPDLADFDEVADWALRNPDECAEIARRARGFALSMVYEDEVDQSGVRLSRLLAMNT